MIETNGQSYDISVADFSLVRLILIMPNTCLFTILNFDILEEEKLSAHQLPFDDKKAATGDYMFKAFIKA